MKNKVEVLDDRATKNWKAFSHKTNRPTEEDEEDDKIFSEEEILENVRRNLLKSKRERTTYDLRVLSDYFKHVNYFK